MVAKRSARAERTQAINQARALIMTGPDDLRARFARHTAAELVAGTGLAAAPAWRRGGLCHPARACGSSAAAPSTPAARSTRLDELIIPARHRPRPRPARLYGVGPDTAALLLIAAGDHPERLRSEAAWAHLCAAAPIPASSGKTQNRHRLNRGGDRQASHALWRIVITRMGSHPPTRAYVARRSKQGLSKPEIIRCLKRYAAREIYRHLRRR